MRPVDSGHHRLSTNFAFFQTSSFISRHFLAFELRPWIKYRRVSDPSFDLLAANKQD